jgi:hypothetical protein
VRGNFYICLKSIKLINECLSSLISRIKEICSYAGEKELNLIISGFRWMGLLSDGKAIVQETLLDTLAKHLEKTMSFQPGERDLVMLQHKFVIEWADGQTVCIPISLLHFQISQLTLARKRAPRLSNFLEIP